MIKLLRWRSERVIIKGWKMGMHNPSNSLVAYTLLEERSPELLGRHGQGNLADSKYSQLCLAWNWKYEMPGGRKFDSHGVRRWGV